MNRWESLLPPLQDFYNKTGRQNAFIKDNQYLLNSYETIESLWQTEFLKIESIRVILFSEAPYWGDKMNYIYNKKSAPTKFMDLESLGYVTKTKISNKDELIDKLNELGIIICDVSPYSFNKTETRFDYNDIDQEDYIALVNNSVDYHLIPKLKTIKEKTDGKVKIVFRYKRVLDYTKPIIQNILEEWN